MLRSEIMRLFLLLGDSPFAARLNHLDNLLNPFFENVRFIELLVKLGSWLFDSDFVVLG